ncbi:MAG: enoyl-CoA hydratase/isomerase family protein [Candidatus Binataceae bacterium]
MLERRDSAGAQRGYHFRETVSKMGSMNYEQIDCATAESALIVTFNWPDKLNAFTFKMLEEANHALRTRVGAGIRAILFRGAGRAFSAGDDLAGMGGTRHPLDEMRAGHHALIKRIRTLRIPVVAAVHGYAFGAAFDLILACDFRVAAASAQLGDIRINRAINSMSGAAFWLPRYVGVGRASEILMLGEQISAAQALEWGLVTRVYADEKFDAAVTQFVSRLAEMPTAVIGANKALMNFGLEHWLGDSLDTEARELLETFHTEDNREGVRAFLEKRAPRFTGR